MRRLRASSYTVDRGIRSNSATSWAVISRGTESVTGYLRSGLIEQWP
jgi:hypothetical protein